jgi:hypothetical protein
LDTLNKFGAVIGRQFDVSAATVRHFRLDCPIQQGFGSFVPPPNAKRCYMARDPDRIGNVGAESRAQM